MKSTVPRLSCPSLQTHRGREIVEIRDETTRSRKKVVRVVLAADLDERLGLINCEKGLFSQSAKA